MGTIDMAIVVKNNNDFICHACVVEFVEYYVQYIIHNNIIYFSKINRNQRPRGSLSREWHILCGKRCSRALFVLKCSKRCLCSYMNLEVHYLLIVLS
jgi:hypothetical protein